MTRYEKGLQQLQNIDGKCGEEVITKLSNISPDLGKYIIEFAFGDIYTRKGLSLIEREMITLSSLLTLGGCESQLQVHIQSAIHVGISQQKIIEIFLQCIPYTGFPRVLNAIFTAQQIFADL
ncbi:MAG: carboxymuconolactone decarboxylase family protein [Firmicutes bacterium]|jgi:4-carboxymuconolactone decarboxylase|nr:carboxymuconolactone decarboxylase family protein [Bacillota bacterium]